MKCCLWNLSRWLYDFDFRFLIHRLLLRIFFMTMVRDANNKAKNYKLADWNNIMNRIRKCVPEFPRSLFHWQLNYSSAKSSKQFNWLDEFSINFIIQVCMWRASSNESLNRIDNIWKTPLDRIHKMLIQREIWIETFYNRKNCFCKNPFRSIFT